MPAPNNIIQNVYSRMDSANHQPLGTIAVLFGAGPEETQAAQLTALAKEERKASSSYSVKDVDGQEPPSAPSGGTPKSRSR